MVETASFLFVMDPAETLNLETETSLLLMEELLKRKQKVFWVEAEGLVLRQNILNVQARPVRNASPLFLEGPLEMAISEFTAIVPRTDPPVNEAFLHLTYLLDFVPNDVHQFNRVSALRDFNEKLLPLRWPNLVPPTLTTMNHAAVEAFTIEHGTIVLKPLGDCSGRGIVKISTAYPDWQQQVRNFMAPQAKPRFVQAQAFLSKVIEGDKRIFLLNGEIIGAVNRRPREGAFLANIHMGASVEATAITPSEKKAIAQIAPMLKANGLVLVGADFIDGYLTELNITSPSAVRQINSVMAANIETKIVDAFLEAIAIGPNSKLAKEN